MISLIFLLLPFDNVTIIHRAQTKHLSLHILYIFGKAVCRLCDILRFLCTVCCFVKIKAPAAGLHLYMPSMRI